MVVHLCIEQIDETDEHTAMTDTAATRTGPWQQDDAGAAPRTKPLMSPVLQQNTDSHSRTAGTAHLTTHTDGLARSAQPLDGNTLNPVTESSTKQLTPAAEVEPAPW